MTRTTAFGAYDEDVYGLVERVWDHVPSPPAGQPRQRYWLVRTKQAVLATGSIERPLVFAGNDRPGVMLAQAARTYLNRFAVSPGKEVVVTTNNDGAYGAAADLAASGSNVTIVDLRQSVDSALQSAIEAVGGRVFVGHGVLAARGAARVSGATIVPVNSKGRASGSARTLPCDLIAVSGVWTPVIHLLSQCHRKAVYIVEKSCFVPAKSNIATVQCTGAMTAESRLNVVVQQGFSTGVAVAAAAGATGADGLARERRCPANFWPTFDWTRNLHAGPRRHYVEWGRGGEGVY